MLTMDITDAEVDRLFGALADRTRRDIVRRSMAAAEGISELADHYDMSFAAVQKHIAVLERAGLVTKHREGKRKLVRTQIEGVGRAQAILDHYEALWRERIDRMAVLIDDEGEDPT